MPWLDHWPLIVIHPGSTPVGDATLVVAIMLTCNQHSHQSDAGAAAMRLLVVTPGDAAVISASFTLDVASGSTLALPACLAPQPMPDSLLVTPAAPACSELVTPAAPACSLWPTPAGERQIQMWLSFDAVYLKLQAQSMQRHHDGSMDV